LQFEVDSRFLYFVSGALPFMGLFHRGRVHGSAGLLFPNFKKQISHPPFLAGIHELRVGIDRIARLGNLLREALIETSLTQLT
jgi:hypothetical protein